MLALLANNSLAIAIDGQRNVLNDKLQNNGVANKTNGHSNLGDLHDMPSIFLQIINYWVHVNQTVRKKSASDAPTIHIRTCLRTTLEPSKWPFLLLVQ